MQQRVDLVAAQSPEQEMALEYLPLFRICRAGHHSPRQGASTPANRRCPDVVLALEQTHRLAACGRRVYAVVMIDWLVVNRLAQSARFGFRTCSAAVEGRAVARAIHATARCQRRAGRMLARARPTRTPA